MNELGSEAPTLLEPWTTHDLAAHLVVREHDYRAAPGLVVPGAWGRFAERRRSALGRSDYGTLLATIYSGPPRGFFRVGWVRRGPNLNEFFVHHEHVRRANGFDRRTNAAALDDALWRNVGFARWFLARRLRGVGLELEWVGRAGCCEHVEEIRLLASPGCPVSCCSTCLAVRARRTSKSAAPERLSKPSSERHSACE